MMVWPGIPEIALIMALSAAALGQPIVQPPVVEESLSEKVTNPFEPLMKITAENAYSPSLWQARGDENEVKGVFVVPFKAFAAQNLTRIKIFFDASASDGMHGLSELQLFDLLLFERRWGTFAAGITALLKPQSVNHRDTLAPGPAVGAVIKRGKWKYGILDQKFLSHRLAQTELQPILSHPLGEKWSAEIGDAQYTYDWKKHRITLLPLSGQLNRILSFKHQDLHLFLRTQYNLKQESGSDKWTLTAGLSLIMQHPE